MRTINIPGKSLTIDPSAYDALPEAPSGIDFLAYFEDGQLQMSVRLNGERIGKVREESDGVNFISDRLGRDPFDASFPLDADIDQAERVEEYAIAVFNQIDGEVYGMIVELLDGAIIGQVLQEVLEPTAAEPVMV